MDKFNSVWVVTDKNVLIKFEKPSKGCYAKKTFGLESDLNCTIFEADALKPSKNGEYILNKSTDENMQIYKSRFRKKIITLSIPHMKNSKRRNCTDFDMGYQNNSIYFGFMNNNEINKLSPLDFPYKKDLPYPTALIFC